MGPASLRDGESRRLAEHQDRRRTAPIETSEGWLLIYHGVLTSCNGFVYSFGAALLDLDQPWRVMYRTEPYLLAPQAPYERVGDVYPTWPFPPRRL